MHQILAVLGILVSGPILYPQDPSQGPVAGGANAAAPDTKTSIFGEPLYVNGKRVSDEQIKLQLIWGPCRMMVELARVNAVIEDEIRRRAAEATEAEIQRRETEKPFGSPEARKAAWDAEFDNQNRLVHEKVGVTPEELQAEVNRMVTDFKKNYPALKLDTEVARAYRSVGWYEHQLRQTLFFDHVFLPENPDEWPIVTLEAVRADSGDILIEDAKQSFIDRTAMAVRYNEDQLKKAEEAKATGQEFEPESITIAKEDELYKSMLRDIVRVAVFRLVEFKTPMDGLPESVALWGDMNGDGKPELELKTEDLWNQVKDTVSPTEIEEAKQWFVTSMATLDRLEKDGFLMNRDDCLDLMKTGAEALQSGMYDMESMATTTYYFPSLDNYAQYFCMLESFKKMMEPQLKPGPSGETPQVLRDHYERANKMMGLGQVDVEVMLVGAFDIGRYRWKPDGWNWARNKAAEIRAKIDANQREYEDERAKILEAKARGQEYTPETEVVEPYRFWTQLMDDHSEYWDPPAPNEPDKKISMVGMKMKGRFGPHYRNDLVTYVGETVYSEWVTGRSITDFVFYDQTEGSVAGPFRGPQGYYITRLLRRTPPNRSLNLSEPKHLELLRDDWLRWKFNQYTSEAVKMAEVRGFTREA
ncbi:MAG: hypothetical protein ACKVXR_15315 [Planctomycetota bacterium]